MNYRILGKTGFSVSEISLGTWQVGGKWGTGFDHTIANNILRQAIDAGINFIDTADVYEAGESEKAVGKAVRESKQQVKVATKCGRQISPHVQSGYTPKVLRAYVEASLQRLGLDTIDLIQLHCPPTEVYYRPEIFESFEDLKKEGKIQHLGVSVEKVEEAIKAIEYENVETVQIIYNMFRQRPQDLFFSLAKAKSVGIIVRVPLASGLLTAAYSKSTQFGESDHRFGNRNGERFDKGETFAGIPYEVGLDAVTKLQSIFPKNAKLSEIALQWILRREEVGCIIPGASKVDQLWANLEAIGKDSLTQEQLDWIGKVYTEDIKKYAHHYW